MGGYIISKSSARGTVVHDYCKNIGLYKVRYDLKILYFIYLLHGTLIWLKQYN